MNDAMQERVGNATYQGVKCFQDIVMTLSRFWASKGCVLLPSYDMEVGAGTFHPATTLQALGPSPWRAAYLQVSRRPADGRYGDNPNRLQRYCQFQVIMKPSPDDFQELYLQSLSAIGLHRDKHDIRFIEDNWESPTLGAWGMGWEVWCDGMEVSQMTYFQQVAGYDCHPVSGELTYGLERLAMHIFDIEDVYSLPYNSSGVMYGDIYRQAEREYSRWNFDVAGVDMLLRHFHDAEDECESILSSSVVDPRSGNKIVMVYPAYDQCIKASHLFNLLDARGVISNTERQEYIARVRSLVTRCADMLMSENDPIS